MNGRTDGTSIGIAAASVIALLLGATQARAADAGAGRMDEGAIKYRQALMGAIGGDMAAISDLLKYGLAYSGNAVVHAEGLASHARLVGNSFERKVTSGKTDAKPEIWEKPDDYLEKVKGFETETAKLVDAAKGGDPAALGAQLKATGKACGSCHDSFRKPKEESYKRAGGGEED